MCFLLLDTLLKAALLGKHAGEGKGGHLRELPALVGHAGRRRVALVAPSSAHELPEPLQVEVAVPGAPAEVREREQLAGAHPRQQERRRGPQQRGLGAGAEGEVLVLR